MSDEAIILANEKKEKEKEVARMKAVQEEAA
jgi:hypothetical protein